LNLLIVKKVLIITYYWPPSGGAGVQRWLKLSKYLLQFNIEPYVITVDEGFASYMQLDKSLEKDVATGVKVFKTKSFEPINYYAKMVGKKNVPTAGFSNVDNRKLKQKLVTFIRSNLFIPDPRKGWLKYAYRKAKQLILEEGINTVITTSPPHSTQLVGLKLKQKLGINWIVDFRDPWTDIYYYKILQHSFISKAIDRNYEKKVLLNADKIVTVSRGFKSIFTSKSYKPAKEKFSIIPNGFDPDDFNIEKKQDEDVFVISYIGTMSEQYEPQVLLDQFKKLVESYPESKILLRFIGMVSKSIKDYISEAGFSEYVEFISTVSHRKAVEYELNSSALILVIPKIINGNGIVPGKLFEYLASGNQIICIGDTKSDVARIIQECSAGQTFNRDMRDELGSFLKKLLETHLKKGKLSLDSEKVETYSRISQAKEISEIINSFD